MTEVKVKFLPEGGFNKNGAFIEYDGDSPTGQETEFQRQSYLTLDIACTDIKLGTSLGVVCEHEQMDTRKNRRWIAASGTIKPARWGQYSLSFLGDTTSTHEISISIHESTADEAATLSGLNIEGDLDIRGYHYFFLELHVHEDRFAKLLEELAAPGTGLNMSVRAAHFKNFYAEWSPSISEGRVIKFLDSKRDVENAGDIPDAFWHSPEFQRQMVSNPDDPPVTIRTDRSLQSFLPAASMTADVDEDDGPPSSAFQAPSTGPVVNVIPAIEELSKRVRRGAFWVSLWLALILVFLVLKA
jgi:hypothetical protein